MGLSMGPPKLSRISLLLFLTAIISSTSAQDITTLETKTCGSVPGLVQCGSGFPFEFCCPSSSTCTPLNSTAAMAAICCPKGEDCSFIQPITCDVNQLNATLHPDNQVHLSDTIGIELPKCGTQCCPLGYGCAGGMCSAEAAAASSTISSVATATSTSNPTNQPFVSQTEAPTAAPVVTERGFNGRSFAAGLFPGLVLGALGTLALIWVIKKRRERQAKERFSGDFGHVARTISDPIYDPQYSQRSDFIRSNSRSTRADSTTGMVQKNTPRAKSIWDRTPKLGFSGWNSTPNSNGTAIYNNASAANTNLGTAVLTNSTPRPPPPAIRAGHHTDPYTTPNMTPAQSSTRSHRSHSRSHKSTKAKYTPQGQSNRPTTPVRSTSTETIDVLMPAPSFLAPPQAPGMRENRMTQDTTFTNLRERAGYDESNRDEVRNYKGRAL
jgi:hypothetical protein